MPMKRVPKSGDTLPAGHWLLTPRFAHADGAADVRPDFTAADAAFIDRRIAEVARRVRRRKSFRPAPPVTLAHPELFAPREEAA